MKTEQEIQEVDGKAQKINNKANKAEKAAQLTFNEATKEESDEFEKVVRPAQKRWQEFSAPHREALRTKLLAIKKVRDEAIAELQIDWGNCPKCGTSYGRYEVFCRNDVCRINLNTYSEVKGVADSTKDNSKMSSSRSSSTPNVAGQCPECGNLLVHQEGCYICPACGYTKC